MATARRAQAHLPQDTEGAAPAVERDLIVIPDIPAPIQLHTMQQVSNAVVEVVQNGDSSGQSSPNADGQHTYIAVATEPPPPWSVNLPVKAEVVDIESEGGAGVNYVQYVDQQHMYSQGHQTNMEQLRSYPVSVYDVGATEGAAEWGGGASNAEYAALGVVVAGDSASAPASPATPAGPPRMPPATVQWLLDHYETAEGVSLPRSTLYSHYLRHCAAHRLDPVNAASFGKLIRSVFVGLRTRRLGTRGNSKYHYYGIQAKRNVATTPPEDTNDDNTDIEQQETAERPPESSPVGAASVHRQYLGVVMAPDPPPLDIPDLPPDMPQTAVQALRRHHRQHGVEFLEAVSALDTAGVERTRRAFWRRPPPDLCRRTLLALGNRPDVAAWLKQAELLLYQRAVELLLPDVLRPIPPQLTQSIRNFAKSLESALATGASGPGGAPRACARAQAAAAQALSGALRRYTSLNHLAQAARAVLTNHHQIQQMLADLNRVDFRVIREQAEWACSCPNSDLSKAMEADFKAFLGRGATLEQWARWLEGCVSRALLPLESHPNYTAKARKLLLDWSFYSSLIIRELTLRSAASFGSFHLIRLLYDEYVSYLVEHRVAAHLQIPPISVMQRTGKGDEDSEDDQPEAETSVETNGVTSGGEEEDADDPNWDWDDDDDDDEDDSDCKRLRMQ